jgi:hypothetical protein
MGFQGQPLFRAPNRLAVGGLAALHRHLTDRDALYASDVFWPCKPEEYREKYLQPQLGLFETATTLGHILEEGSPTRAEYRNMIFFENAYSHWQNTIREPQKLRSSSEPIEIPRALQGHSHG